MMAVSFYQGLWKWLKSDQKLHLPAKMGYICLVLVRITRKVVAYLVYKPE